MAATKVAIFNLALSAVGTRATVSAAGESTREAEVCDLWYDEVVFQLLHAAPWASTTGVERLTEIKERDAAEDWVAGDPEPGWRFAYEAPEDMLRPRHLSTYERFELSIMADDTHAIMTDAEDALLVYTKKQETTSKWDPALTMAIVYALASHIALPLQGKPERARYLVEMANIKAMEARVASANTDESQLETIPPWISARGYASGAPTSRYVYPFGPLLSSTAVSLR